jgi:hypothetical protein
MKTLCLIFFILFVAATTGLIGAHWENQTLVEKLVDQENKLKGYETALIIYPKELQQDYQVNYTWQDALSGKQLAVACKFCKWFGIFPYLSQPTVISL